MTDAYERPVDRILTYVSANPGRTTSEIVDATSIRFASSTLARLRRSGYIVGDVKTIEHRSVYAWRVAE